MTLIKRLRTFFARDTSSPVSMTSSVAFTPASMVKSLPGQTESVLSFSPTPSVYNQSDFLPDWLADDESLRDEGILFGLSDARADGKIAEIRAAFAQQSAPLEERIEHHTEKISELNLFIEQRENHLITLRDQTNALRYSQPTPHNLIRTVVSLCLSVVMCIGTFYLIDVTLQPAFSNPWIAVGVFLAGMFNLFGRLSFFYDTETRLSGRRIVEEVGLPLAASIFVLTQGLQTQSVGSATGLFVFVFFAFLLSGKLLLSTLTTLQNDLYTIVANRQLVATKERDLPVWTSEIERMEREIDAIRTQKWPIVTALNHEEASLNRLNAHRDRLVNLFLSEFELARSLRKRLTEQQLKSMMNYE